MHLFQLQALQLPAQGGRHAVCADAVWTKGRVNEGRSAGLWAGPDFTSQPQTPTRSSPTFSSPHPPPFTARHQGYQKGKLDFIIKLATKSPQHHEVASWAGPGGLAAG